MRVVRYAALTGLAAQVAVYLNPAVPNTGQTFAALLAGAVLGSKRGVVSMLVYLGTGTRRNTGIRPVRSDLRCQQGISPWICRGGAHRGTSRTTETNDLVSFVSVIWL